MPIEFKLQYLRQKALDKKGKKMSDPIKQAIIKNSLENNLEKVAIENPTMDKKVQLKTAIELTKKEVTALTTKIEG